MFYTVLKKTLWGSYRQAMNTHQTIRERGNRPILGLKDDVRITAAYIKDTKLVSSWRIDRGALQGPP